MANRHTKPTEDSEYVFVEIPKIQVLISEKIADQAQASEKNFSIDPFTIMAILNCIIALVKLLYMCYSKESIANKMVNKSAMHRFLLKREIRKKFREKTDREALYNAMLEVSKQLSETEKKELIDSIIGDK